jgi:hypothetical protein
MAFQRLVAECKKLIAAADTHEVEMPSLGCYKAALEEALEDVTACKARQISLKAKSLEATSELNGNLAVVREEAARLKNLVLAGFGRNDERLADFGIKPVGRRRRKSAEKGGRNGSPGHH